MKHPFLIGPRVYLRALEREDAPLLREWINDPEVTRFLQIYRPMNLPAEEQFIDKANQGEHDLVLGIAMRATDQLVGGIGLHAIDFKDRHAGVGIMLGVKDEWSKGYGGEAIQLLVRHAFETLNLNRVWLRVYEYNERARRCYERIGFRLEGVLRQDHFIQGRYWDTLTMAILREEWNAE